MVPGEIVDGTGAVVGRHRGAAIFTVGQRRGLDVAAGERRYVLDVDGATARVTIGRAEELLRSQVALEGLSFVDGRPAPDEPLLVQVRAHGQPFEGRLRDGVVDFARPQPRVAPGQAVVLYRGDTVVGGGLAAP
jgi:tRNA-specific 2-thiouridylase